MIPPSIDCEDEVETASINVTEVSKTRKRDEGCWRRNIIKKAREKGEAYVSHSGHAVAVARKEPPLDEPLCYSKCRFKCSERITNEARQKIFDDFYRLDYEAQNAHLFSCLSSHAPKTIKSSGETHRQISVEYSTYVEKVRLRVCKRALENLLRITKS